MSYNKRKAYYKSIGSSISKAMKQDKRIIVSGLEVDYSSKVFGTLAEPYKKYRNRFIQTPAMENGLCNILAGAAISGVKPIFVNNRCDFLLLSFDSIVNIIDKWRYMFDGNAGKCPIVITAIIGRGWGQGSTHSQSFHSFFARLTGFEIFLPAFSNSVENVYNHALKSNKPSIILHHRSLLNLKSEIQRKKSKLLKSEIIKKGTDLLIISFSITTIQALNVHKILMNEYKFNISILDLVSLKPLDDKAILKFALNHSNILILDIDHGYIGLGTEIENIIRRKFPKKTVKKMSNKFLPAPVAESLEKKFYLNEDEILKECIKLLKFKKKINKTFYKTKYNYKKLGPY